MPLAPPKDEREHGSGIDLSSGGKGSGDPSYRDAEGTCCSRGQHVELLQERIRAGKGENLESRVLGISLAAGSGVKISQRL